MFKLCMKQENPLLYITQQSYISGHAREKLYNLALFIL